MVLKVKYGRESKDCLLIVGCEYLVQMRELMGLLWSFNCGKSSKSEFLVPGREDTAFPATSRRMLSSSTYDRTYKSEPKNKSNESKIYHALPISECRVYVYELFFFKKEKKKRESSALTEQKRRHISAHGRPHNDHVHRHLCLYHSPNLVIYIVCKSEQTPNHIQ